MNYTYMLECDDGSYYTGWTNNLKKRYHAHCSGRGARYTKMHPPVRIAYFETYDDFHDAMHREWEIKQLDHRQKRELAASFEKDVSEYMK